MLRIHKNFWATTLFLTCKLNNMIWFSFHRIVDLFLTIFFIATNGYCQTCLCLDYNSFVAFLGRFWKVLLLLKRNIWFGRGGAFKCCWKLRLIQPHSLLSTLSQIIFPRYRNSTSRRLGKVTFSSIIYIKATV